jgi:hypothetical protein
LAGFETPPKHAKETAMQKMWRELEEHMGQFERLSQHHDAGFGGICLSHIGSLYSIEVLIL